MKITIDLDVTGLFARYTVTRYYKDCGCEFSHMAGRSSGYLYGVTDELDTSSILEHLGEELYNVANCAPWRV